MTFVQTTFKLLRDFLHIRPGLTAKQFLEEVRADRAISMELQSAHRGRFRHINRDFCSAVQGFAERKILLLLSMIQSCRAVHADAERKLKVCTTELMLHFEPLV